MSPTSENPKPTTISGDGIDIKIGSDNQNVYAGKNINVNHYILQPTAQTTYVNVPSMPSHFVGRETLVDELATALISGQNRALSAEGLPGVGKTTLAVALAHHKAVLESFSDGVLWAGLGPNGDPLIALDDWAVALGTDVTSLPDVMQRSDAIKRAISDKKMLIVWDDVWTLPADPGWLRCGGPNCAHLLTTRDHTVASAFAGAQNATNVDVLTDEDAWDLLQNLAPKAAASDANAVRELLAKAGGLPLTVDLLGSYLGSSSRRYFSAQVAAALSAVADPAERLQLAKVRLGTVNGQMETLAATIALSLADLAQPTQQAFYGLSAFAPKPASFQPQAAEIVAEASLDDLALLLDRNLLEIDGDETLSLHQTLHDFAAAELGEERRGTGRVRHRDHYLERTNADPEDWRTIAEIYPQMMWAWERQLEVAVGDKELLEIVEALRVYQMRRGLLSDYLEFAQQGLANTRATDNRSDEGTLLNNMATTAHARGDYETALKYLEQSLTISQDIGDKSGEGTTLNNISQIFKARGDYETALKYLEQSLTIRQDIGDKSGEGTTLNNISQIYDARGDYETALKYLEQSLTISQDIGDKSGEGTTLNNISQIFKARGDYETALKYLEQSLTIRQDIGDKSGEGTTLNNISQIFKARGDYETALKYLEQSLTIRQDIGDKSGEGTTLNNISQIYDARGDYETALNYLEQSLTISQDIGDAAGVCATLFNMGHISWQNDQQDEAMGMWINVYQLASQIELAQVLKALASLAGQLGLEGGLEAWARLAGGGTTADAY